MAGSGIIPTAEIRANDMWTVIDNQHFNAINDKNRFISNGSLTSWVQPTHQYTETFDASTGDNNTVSGNGTAGYEIEKKSFIGANIYDVFDDASIATGSWATGTGGTGGGVSETGGYLYITAEGGGTDASTGAGSAYSKLLSGKTNIFFDVSQSLHTPLTPQSATVTTSIYLGSVIGTATLIDTQTITNDNTFSGADFNKIFYLDYLTNGSVVVYKNGALVGSYAPTNKEIHFYCYHSYTYGGGGGTMTNYARQYVYNVYDSIGNKTLTTPTIITESSNIKGVFCTPKLLSGNATYDISLNGGTTYPITAQSFGSYIDTSAQTGSVLGLKFNLNASGLQFPNEIKDYAVSTWV